MNTLTDPFHIPDTQSARDERHLAIQRVGVKDVRYPLSLTVAGAVQQTAARWNLDVALPADQKGTHMSRFVEILSAHEREVTVESFQVMLREMVEKLGKNYGQVFPVI